MLCVRSRLLLLFRIQPHVCYEQYGAELFWLLVHAANVNCNQSALTKLQTNLTWTHCCLLK